MSVGRFLQQAAAGGGVGEPVYVEDVFSTYLYEGTGSAQSINNGLDLGAYPFVKISSTDGNSVSGSETFTVNVKAGTKLVVFALDSSSSVLSCTLDGASLTAKTSSTSWYGVAVFIETLTAGTHTIVVGDNNIGHTEVMLFDPNATVSVETNLAVSAQNATSVTTSAVTTDGFCVFLGSDRDPGANFSSNQTSTEYYEVTHTYFNFGAIAINGSSGTVPATTISGMVGTYATNWCLLKVEGIGNDPTANSAASGEGGLVWIKNRDASVNHQLHDTERGASVGLNSNNTNAQYTDVNAITSFNAGGFSMNNNYNSHNQSGVDFVSWTFRKQPGFFDVVTYTGNGTNRTINHNLGSTPGMIIVKSTSHAENWFVFHTSTGPTKSLLLESTSAALTRSDWNNTAPTESVFTVGSFQGVNGVGKDFVAYLFAHDAQDFGTDSDESIIKCGSFTTDGSGNASVDLGFEPQWILAKTSASANQWVIVDTMRGLSENGTSADKHLWPNSANAEMNYSFGHPTATGFEAKSLSGSQTYIYVAIRRPHKPAEEFAATNLFNTIARSGNNTTTQVPVGFPVDLFFSSTRNNAWYTGVTFDRLRGKSVFLQTPSTVAEAVNTNQFTSFDQDGITVGADGSGWINNSTPTYVYHLFRRAPGFFDVVCYDGTGSARTITHNLGVTPEFIIAKSRTEAQPWVTYDAATGATKYLRLEGTNAAATYSGIWNNTAPTSSVFSTGGDAYINKSGHSYVAYLFASVAGISKVGTYTGDGTTDGSKVIDCGMPSGPRFVLAKKTSSTGHWFLFDSERGIVTNGNDYQIRLNSSDAETTSQDKIDIVTNGFCVKDNAGSTNGKLNHNNQTYIFLAIA